MKIKLNTSRVGEGVLNNAGDVIEVPDDEAARYVKSGQAEYVAEQRQEPRGPGRPPKSDQS